jgi:hypothetical protein
VWSKVLGGGVVILMGEVSSGHKGFDVGYRYMSYCVRHKSGEIAVYGDGSGNTLYESELSPWCGTDRSRMWEKEE